MECPKCGADRGPEQVSCAQCGLVFHKYERYLERRAAFEAERRQSYGRRLLPLLRWLSTPHADMVSLWWGYAALWLILVVWGWGYMTSDIDTLGHRPGFLHNVNLPFHEAGHLLFSPLGRWIGALGGTLGQLLMPTVCGIVLLYQRADTFGASVCLWWFGQNFLDIAPYMADARAGQLPLIGGNFGHSSPYGFHDWEFILGELGLLNYDTAFAACTLNVGRLLMLIAYAWGGWLLWQAWYQSVDLSRDSRGR